MRKVFEYALCAICLTVLAGGAHCQGTTPSDAESVALAAIRGKVAGRIVWESNRTGHWELYTMNADGTGARKLTNFAADGERMPYGDYLRPRISPDGRWVMHAYSAKRPRPCEVWITSLETGESRSLTEGNPLNWTTDGTGIFYVYQSKLHKLDLVKGETQQLHNATLPTDGAYGSMVGSVQQDLSSAIFRTSRTNEWFPFDQGMTAKTMGGCESRFTIDDKYLYWVQGPKDFRIWDMAADTEHEVLGTPDSAPHDYTYFPTISPDNRWILYGASPSQHDHTKSDYEVYAHELQDMKPIGKPVRLTFNGKCDRWPDMWVAPENALAAGPYDVVGNRNLNPPPPPLAIFSFASDGAGPEVGGQWGLWPQEDGCRGDTTWVAEDAEGKGGGSMKIDYTIAEDPKSFSLWTAPGVLDLTAYDRMTLFAKGDVPSVTLVVKDGNVAEPDDPDGIAEYLLEGVTDEWQMFEVRFSDFEPRKAGTEVDWRSLNHLGICMIAPQNAESGTLQIDNITAVPVGE